MIARETKKFAQICRTVNKILKKEVQKETMFKLYKAIAEPSLDMEANFG